MTHPITPPPELVAQWLEEASALRFLVREVHQYVATRAAQWAADQELDACCEWVSQWTPRWPDGARPEDKLRAARRPEPPSLKEINLKHLDAIERDGHYLPEILQDLRRAVEQLND